MHPLDLRRCPPGFLGRRAELHHAHFFSFPILRFQLLQRKQRRLFVVANHGVGHVQNSFGGAVILRKRSEEFLRRSAHPGLANLAESLQEDREAAVGRSAKAINRLVVVAHRHDVAMVARQQPQQLDLRDVRVLEFVDQDVSIPLLQFRPQACVASQQFHSLQQHRAKCQQIALAQEPVAHSIDACQLFLPRQFVFGDRARIGLQRLPARLETLVQPFHIAPVIFG